MRRFLLFFLFLGIVSFLLPQKVSAATIQQVLAQSQIGDKAYEVRGDSFYAYGGSCAGTGCQITEPPAPSRWKLTGFNEASWPQSIDVYSQDGALHWWCGVFSSNCRPIGQIPGTYTAGDPDQITGSSGFINMENVLFRKAYTVNPPAGYKTSQVELKIWSDNNSWAFVEGNLITTGGLGHVTTTTLPGEALAINMTSLALTGYSNVQTFTKEFVIQVSNDDQCGGEIDCRGNPIGVQYRITAIYESLPPPPVLNPPTITSLQINNNDNVTGGFSSTFKSSGLSTLQGGKGWYNPMTIKLNANQGSNSIKSYYVTFYDSSIGSTYSSIIDSATEQPSTDLKSLLKADGRKGFVLRYDTGGSTYVWNPSLNSGNGGWRDLSLDPLGYLICGSLGCASQTYYTIYPIASSSSWKVAIDQNVRSRNFYTAAYVIDNSAAKLADYEADCTTTSSTCLLSYP